MKIEELETIVRSVGMDAGLMSMGAASCIYSEGCEGVTMDDLLKLVAALEEHALALQAESEARDAARYRWLLSEAVNYERSGDCVVLVTHFHGETWEQETTAAIDAAMAEKDQTR